MDWFKTRSKATGEERDRFQRGVISLGKDFYALTGMCDVLEQTLDATFARAEAAEDALEKGRIS